MRAPSLTSMILAAALALVASAPQLGLARPLDLSPRQLPSAAGTSPSSSVAAPAATPTGTKPTAAATKTAGVAALGPAPHQVFRAGEKCTASWTPDASGATTWKSMEIALMTGSNLNMTKLATVASGVDGTKPSPSTPSPSSSSSPNTTSAPTSDGVGTYDFTCPLLDPPANIYFLQFSHDGGKDASWTSRFTVADAQGKTVAEPEANQPEGGEPKVPWGLGRLVVANPPTAGGGAQGANASTQMPASSAVAAAQLAQLQQAQRASGGGRDEASLRASRSGGIVVANSARPSWASGMGRRKVGGAHPALGLAVASLALGLATTTVSTGMMELAWL